MEFIDKMKAQARQNIKTIILPEVEDIRILQATDKILKEGFAKIMLLGNREELLKRAEDNNIDIKNAQFYDVNESENARYYIEELYKLRKDKGMTLEEAEELIKTNSRYLATMIVKLGDADGYVSGASHSTSDTFKPVLRIIKGAGDIKTISSFFVMDCPDKNFGEDGIFIFSDSGMNENPTAEALADIARASGNSFRELINKEPRVAMLSYSTKGSAKSELTDKVVQATKLVNKKNPQLLCDGEMQLDAAIVPEIAAMKAPSSPVAGKANVLIFPDLNSGNIAYKLVQRLGHAKAYGPLCQGLARPVNDLSRGCSVDDIVGVVAITCVQAINI